MQAQLNLDEYFVDELVIRKNINYDREKPIIGDYFIDFDILRHDKNPLMFKLSMFIELNKNDDNSPYYILMKLSGFFSYADETDDDYIKKTIALNAPSILYGVARGIIAQVTGNYEYGKFILPAVNFIEILKRKSDTKKLKGKTTRKKENKAL